MTATSDRGCRLNDFRVRPTATPVPWSGAGIEVARGAVDEELIEDALRLLHIDLLERGADARELGSWLWEAHWFPHLNYDERIWRWPTRFPRRGRRAPL